ncbi:hypothetical protein BH10PLA1_BH10PLA1_10680 [soil metagenome]
MASARFAWGIDVGNRALKAIKLVRDGTQLRIDDFEVIEHETVLSQSGDNRASLIQTAIANFVQRHPMKGGAVAIGVSGQSSFARFIKLPPVEAKKIPEIVRFEAIQQIPFPLDDVEWAYQLFRDDQSPDVEVGIFAMRKDLVNKNIEYFTSIGLNVEAVQMNPLAVYNAVYYDQRITGTTMVVDLGAENTDLIIAEGETVWLRSIPIGGNNFTEALVKSFKLNFEKAEDLKRNAATSKYAKQIFQAMRPIFAELVAEIQRSIGFYASVHRDSRITKVIALGGTFRLPGLQKYLQQNLQLPVERIDSVTAAPPTDAKLATTFNENILSTIGAYGLAIQAMGGAKINSSLLPKAIQRDRAWRAKSKWFAAAAALFVVGTAGVNFGSYYVRNVQYASQDGVRKEVADTIRKAQGYDQQWSQVESAGAEARTRLQNVQSLLPERTLWPHLLADFYSFLPIETPAGKALPRPQRDFIYIDSIGSQYVSDMSSLMTMPADEFRRRAVSVGPGGGTEFTGGGDLSVGAVPVAGAVVPRGYLITVRCTTPSNKGVVLLSNNFMKAVVDGLTEKNAGANRPYYMGRAITVKALQMKNSPGLVRPVAAGPTAPGAPAGSTPAMVDPLKDPVTGEDMSDDWQATLLFAVVIK